MSINHYVDLNMSASVMPPVLNMAQYDANSRTIVATLWDGTSGFTVPSGAVVMVRFGKPDNTGGLYDKTESGEAITYSGNVVTAPVATQMLSVAGKVQADIEIYQSGATEQASVKLATFCFTVNVEKAAYPDAEIISSDYYNIISGDISEFRTAQEQILASQAALEEVAGSITGNVESAQQAAQTATEKANAAATSAQNAASSETSANNANASAQTAKTNAESAKTAAENAKTSAESSASSAETSAQNAAQDAEDAEAWAVGQRNGVNVTSTDPAYQNNAKYYKDLAQAASGGGVLSVNGKTPNDSGTVTLVASDINTSSGDSIETALNNKAGKSTGVSVTLPASGWDAGAKTQTVSVAGVTATANGSLRIAQTATDEQFTAWGAAKPRVTAQTDGSITIKLAGTVPTIDIPVEVLIV